MSRSTSHPTRVSTCSPRASEPAPDHQIPDDNEHLAQERIAAHLVWGCQMGHQRSPGCSVLPAVMGGVRSRVRIRSLVVVIQSEVERIGHRSKLVRQASYRRKRPCCGRQDTTSQTPTLTSKIIPNRPPKAISCWTLNLARDSPLYEIPRMPATTPIHPIRRGATA